MRYRAYAPLVDPARPSAGLKWLAAGVVMTTITFILLSYGYSILHQALVTPDEWTRFSAELETARTPATVLINLFLFALLIAALMITLRVVHHRSLLGLIGPLPRTARQFRRIGVALVILYAVIAFLPAPAAITPSPNLAFGRWLSFLPFALIGLLIQTSAEELIFRGYLQSQLAARFAHPVVWIGLPAVAFGLLHYDWNMPASTGWVIVLWATLFSAAASDLTARAGTLGPAIALHLINNLSAILIAAPLGAFDGLALYTYPFSLASSDALMVWAPVDLMILLCSWLAARLALRR